MAASGYENPIRQALLNRIRADWEPVNVSGWDPTAGWGDSNRLYAHLGEYDDEMPEPQLTIRDVSAEERNGGVSGWKSDGSGIVQAYDLRVQVDTWTDGSISDDPEALAEYLALEAREILHRPNGILIDPTDGEVISALLIPLSRPRIIPDPEEVLTAYQAMMDIGIRIREDPPQRHETSG